MPGELSKAAAIVGAAEANEIGYPEDMKTAIRLHIEAIKNVSDQTGIPISMIDGVFGAGWSSQIAEHLGIHPAYIDTTAVGGCSFEMHVHHALAPVGGGDREDACETHRAVEDLGAVGEDERALVVMGEDEDRDQLGGEQGQHQHQRHLSHERFRPEPARHQSFSTSATKL